MVDLIQSLRVGNIFCLFHIGDMPDDKVRYSSKLFAEKVMPRLKQLWPEYGNDGRFWLKPAPARAEAAE